MRYELDIKRVRKALGKSAAETADGVGVHISTLYYWEARKKHPSSEQIALVAAYLGCAPGDLFIIKFD